MNEKFYLDDIGGTVLITRWGHGEAAQLLTTLFKPNGERVEVYANRGDEAERLGKPRVLHNAALSIQDRLGVTLTADDPAVTPAVLRYVLALPMPPSANVYWRNNPHSHRPYRSGEADAFKAEVALLAAEQGVREPLSGRLAVTLHVHFTRVNGDLDNRIKVTLDALNEIAWHDDNQVDELHVYRHVVPPREKKRRGEPEPAPRIGKVDVEVRER